MPSASSASQAASRASWLSYSKAKWWMPVCAICSGSSLSPGTASMARRWLAPSLVSQQASGAIHEGSIPTTRVYQSIISCMRVVLRLTWCRTGLAPMAQTSGVTSLSTPRRAVP